jgi:hypothetical protein
MGYGSIALVLHVNEFVFLEVHDIIVFQFIMFWRSLTMCLP